jgi:hypothetical protein
VARYLPETNATAVPREDIVSTRPALVTGEFGNDERFRESPGRDGSALRAIERCAAYETRARCVSRRQGASAPRLSWQGWAASRVFALTPLLFAVQQVSEGVVWLTINPDGSRTALHQVAVAAFWCSPSSCGRRGFPCRCRSPRTALLASSKPA